ncbi:hypothetical protein GCM10027093_63210 [Paraburkholderia jirisanensis]
MLVAIALLAVVAVIAWRGLDATIRGRDDLVGSLVRTRTLGRYFSQLQFDALNIVAPEEVFGPPLRMRHNELVLVRHIGIGANATRVQVIRYQLKGSQLSRTASAPLSSLSQLSDALTHMDSFAGAIVSNDVKSLGVSVWLAPTGWTDSQSVIADAYARFLDAHGIAAVASRGVPLPRGLRITLTTVHPAASYVRTIPLHQ